MKRILLLILCSLFIIPTYARTIKRNSEGKKMIRSIFMEQFAPKDAHTQIVSRDYSYTFDYFPDGLLQSVKLSWKDDGIILTKRLYYKDGLFHYETTTGGKKDPAYDVDADFSEFTRDSGAKGIRLGSLTLTQPEWDDEEGKTIYYRSVTSYDPFGILVLKFKADNSYSKELESIKSNPEIVTEYSEVIGEYGGVVFNYLNLSKNGFSGISLIGKGNDGRFYKHYNTQNYPRRKIGFNYYRNLPDPRYPNAYGDIFTKRVNDTNINLQEIYNPEFLELVTEWVICRSSNLIEKEDCVGDKYHRKWEYEYDTDGNLTGILIEDRNFIWHKVKVSIEYVYED